MTKDRILAIEDDEGVCRLLLHSLAREDYDVHIAHNGETGLQQAVDNPPDLVLLDLELPGLDGLSICQLLKQNPKTRSLPVIILTGKGEESDVVEGLQMGADDYIVKPFSPKILNARVQAVLRRRSGHVPSPENEAVFQCGNLVIDSAHNSIRISGNEVDLTPQEYRFALLLACHASGEDLNERFPQMIAGDDPVSFIGREGMALYSENRLGRLRPVLDELVDAGYAESGLLSEFCGLSMMERDPEQALQFLNMSERYFREANDPLGELVSLANLIFYHVVFDGNENMACRYLERAEALSRACFDRLSVYSRVSVAQNMAIGRAYLHNDFSGANEYLSIAEALAEDRGLINLVVLNRMVKIIESYALGDPVDMAEGIEDSVRFSYHPQVSRLHKSLLRILYLKYFSLTGQFAYLQLQEKKFLERFRGQLSGDNLGAVHLVICHLENLLYHDRFAEALALTTDALMQRRVAANDLVRPILNGIRALSAVLCEELEDMQMAVDACRADLVRPTFRSILGSLYCARALTASGDVSGAVLLLARVAPVAREKGWANLDFQARAQQLLLRSDEPEAIRDELAQLLTEMQEQGTWYLQTLVGDDYHRLFRTAEAAGVDTGFVRLMLRRRLAVVYDVDGKLVPLLQLSTFGGFRVSLGGEPVALTDAFSRTQREFLALLIAMPDHRITQEEVQLTFWPDSRPEKARSSLDTMLSRLRRTLKEKLKPHAVKTYLKLQKGVISLENVVVDADEVTAGIGRARELKRRGDHWQADVEYSIAFARLHGPFMPGSCSADVSAHYARKLQHLTIEASSEWSELLIDSGQTAQAIDVLSQALALDRGNEQLMKALYRSTMRDGNIARAHQLLQQFEETFRHEGYSPSETARLIAGLKSSDI